MDGLQKILSELNHLSDPSDMDRRVELCRQALEIVLREDKPELWGKLQDDLACSLVKMPSESKADNIETAIYHFEQALEVRNRQKHPNEWAITQSNLATAYRERIYEKRAENIEKAIQYYHLALEIKTRQADAASWAMTHFNLGIAFLEQESLKESIEHAIAHFKQALEVYTFSTSPEYWAAIQQNLGVAYTTRVLEKRAENIEQAILHLRQALEIYTREDFPQDWASVHYNLGNAYGNRIWGDRIENIKQAIQHFSIALEVRNQKTFPTEWARTQGSLGDVYLVRNFDGLNKNIENAVDCYKKALKVYNPRDYPDDWARICNSFGNACMAWINTEKGENNNKNKYIKQAITNYKKALTVRTRNKSPKDWAETQSNLAGAERIRASDKDLEHAIQGLESVLDVYTRDTFPHFWARTHNNLALIYTDRKQGRLEDNIKQAISHYQQALEVYNVKDFPEACLKTARGLGKLAFDEKYWEVAKDAYELMFQAQNVLMHFAFSSTSEKAELSETQNLPSRAAYAHVKLGNFKRAVEILENGRVQLLRQSFDLQQQSLKGLVPLGFGHLYNDYMKARNEYKEFQDANVSKHDHRNDWQQLLEKVQAAVAAIRDVAGRDHPQYRYFMKALSFGEIQEQAGQSPLVYLCSTSVGGFALVISRYCVLPVEIPELEQEALQNEIWRPSNEEVERINKNIQNGVITYEDIQAVKGGFFSTYALWSLVHYLDKASPELKSQLFLAWKDTLDETGQWLWDKVIGRLISVLKEFDDAAILIPTGQLAWLPLHAAWVDDPSKPTHRRYALDELNISYAPSIHSLRQASLAAEKPRETLLAVDNPDGSLSFSGAEVQVALAMFKKSFHYGSTATVQKVKEMMQRSQVMHFSTHGRAGWEKAEQALLVLADGNLTLSDIYKLDLHQSRLAILSACETGVPGLELPDEMIGLPAGLMQAGVPGVVGSLWSVSDISTAMLMACFYGLLHGRLKENDCEPKSALRQAQIWLRDSTTDEKLELFDQIARLSGYSARTFYETIGWDDPDAQVFKSPYYWAAFTYTGV